VLKVQHMNIRRNTHTHIKNMLLELDVAILKWKNGDVPTQLGQIKTAIFNHSTMCASKLLDYLHKICSHLHAKEWDYTSLIRSNRKRFSQPLHNLSINSILIQWQFVQWLWLFLSGTSKCLPTRSTEDRKGTFPETFSFIKCQ
jgi:hypothetical protein